MLGDTFPLCASQKLYSQTNIGDNINQQSQTVISAGNWKPSRFNSNLGAMSLLSENEIPELNFATRKLGRTSGVKYNFIKNELFLFVFPRPEYDCDLPRRLMFLWMSHKQAYSKAIFTRILAILVQINRWNGTICRCGSSIRSWSATALRWDVYLDDWDLTFYFYCRSLCKFTR